MLTGVLCNSMTVQAADTDEHRMNVVFVLDQSGSMAKTDAMRCAMRRWICFWAFYRNRELYGCGSI